MKLLKIDSSILGDSSATRQLSAAIVDAFIAANPVVTITSRDLVADPLPHFDGSSLPGVRAEGADHPDDRILEEFLDADVVVIGAPMYNFAVPSQLKAWVDRILIAGKTFRYTETGPVGLAAGKRVVIASARGGLYAPGMPSEANDFQETYLRAVFAFIGIDDVEFIRAEGIAFSPEHRANALEGALASVPAAADRLVTALAA
jgi:FMN-dependent NADH-azoreductase